MAKSKSSSKWLQEHFSDKYVKQSRKDGYCARSAYKLLELDDKYKLLKPGIRVVDLGAAPGGWSQVVARKTKGGKIIALDLLPIKKIAGVTTIQGDFREEKVLDKLKLALKNQTVDLILSDMAPNFSGHKAVDMPRVIYLAELALDFAKETLNQKGNLVTKAFQGEGFDSLLQELRLEFKQVFINKPKASRDRSNEVFLVCKDKMSKPHYNQTNDINL